MANTVIGRAIGEQARDEQIANAAITPGMLVERVSTGKVQAHSTAGGVAEKLFALEDENQGNGITDAYTNGDLVKLWHPRPGDRVYALSDDTTGTDIAIGDFVESDGSGRLRKWTGDNSSAATRNAFPIAVAVEAAGVGPDGAQRFLVEIV